MLFLSEGCFSLVEISEFFLEELDQLECDFVVLDVSDVIVASVTEGLFQDHDPVVIGENSVGEPFYVIGCEGDLGFLVFDVIVSALALETLFLDGVCE